MIKKAIDFILSEVDVPALNHPEIIKEIKYKVTNTKVRINSFKKVGDLKIYMNRFSDAPKSGNDLVYNSLKNKGLKTYEDIYSEFEEKFQRYFDDVTVLNDFVIGQTYTSWDISNFARDYDNRKGIYLIGEPSNLSAIFIKVTLENGKYANEWLEENRVLKYYFKNRANKFKLEYQDNFAIYSTKDTDIPIYVFIKEDTRCVLHGVFKYVQNVEEADGSKWFELEKIDHYQTLHTLTNQEYENDLDIKVTKSQIINSSARKERLKQAVRKPEVVEVVTTQYKRNPDVIAEVLERANGYCEECKQEAPFKRAKDGTPYLEVHHVIPLAKGGEDSVENTLGLCPNCHRKAHYG
ncbi:5-methylcytosine-specific restriction enzyme A [Bacillus sp. 5mfcol3.1]|uniref:HNH endonuclease n=1 Tax=Bacillus sp. 5mfcol3.1 TaxID=1761756 RepID=UPI0008DF24E3|nr:HNH endonuclease signature motif containing protein [Bacillus sp. 5mfcol3.1]SFK73823.1 5-methylcytosine-specific restriction enzyme A [Bacillus sp. 5mfcol3.1]SIQ40811.1 5-methylcytosine-specific restriction enzyme A [Bacillus cereus]